MRSQIGLIAAMPEEVRPFLHLIRTYQREKKGAFDLYRFKIEEKEISLIQSGMGVSRAADATRLLIETTAPSIVLNFGFAGAVTAGPQVGELLLADKILSYDGNEFKAAGTPAPTLAVLLHDLDTKFFMSTFITTLQITQKSSLATLLPASCSYPALEMESAAVAHVTAEAGVPFAAIRAVSDAANEELGFSLDEFTDREMNIRISRVLKTVARKPWIIPQLLRLARNSTIAGKNLAGTVAALVQKL